MGEVHGVAQRLADLAVSIESPGLAGLGAGGVLGSNTGQIGGGGGAGTAGRQQSPERPGGGLGLDPRRATAALGGRSGPAALSPLLGGEGRSPFSADRDDLFPGLREPILGAYVEGIRLGIEANQAFAESARETFQQSQAEAELFAEGVRQDLLHGVVGTVELLGQAVVGGLGDFDEAFKAVGGSVANTLGDMMINAGTTIVLTSTAFEEFKKSLITLVPGAGIGAGLLLIAAGAAMKSAVGGFLANPTRSGSGSAGSGGLGSFNELRPPADRKIVNIHLPGGDFINLADWRQREAFKAAIREVVGTGEVNFVGA